ncbi:hypothetical protein LINGRAHAP2_LOCUS34436 [Linum grandiflorum]
MFLLSCTVPLSSLINSPVASKLLQKLQPVSSTMEAMKPSMAAQGSRHELLEQGRTASQKSGGGSPLMAQLTALKIIAIVSTASAICVMVTSDQNVVVYQIPFSARYSYASAFKLSFVFNFVIINPNSASVSQYYCEGNP